MTASRTPLPKPDMGGVGEDWKRLQDLRDAERRKDQERAESSGADQGEDQAEEQPTRRRKSQPGRSRGGRKPPPASADAVPTTVRFDPEEASEVDFFVLELRDDAGRRNLDKAEVIREVLRLAREHEPTRKALLKRLK